MRIIWNLFLVVTGLLMIVIFPPLVLINIALYFVFKPKQQPQNITVVVRDKD